MMSKCMFATCGKKLQACIVNVILARLSVILLERILWQCMCRLLGTEYFFLVQNIVKDR